MKQAHPQVGGVRGGVVLLRLVGRLVAAVVLLLPRRQLLPPALLAVLQSKRRMRASGPECL